MILNIKIGENWKVTSDQHNVILNQRYEKQKDGQPSGEFDFKSVGFYNTFLQVCESLMDKELKVSDAENLGEIVRIIHLNKRDIQGALEIHKDERIQELQKEIRSLNAKLNEVKAISRRAYNKDEEVDPDAILRVLEPKVDSVVNGG